LPEVLVNARAAARSELSGVERWAVELCTRLPALRPGAYAIARPPRTLAYRAGQAWEQLALPLRARAVGARIVLNPANLAPLAWPGNVVVMHDAVALTHPEWFSTAYATWHGRLVPAIARRARRLVTVSSFSRDELAEATGVVAEVVPGGVDERFAPDADAVATRRALGLERPYVVCVGGDSPRKNYAALGEVARALAPRGVEMVTAGTWRAHHGPRSSLEAVRALGYVDEALLPGLFRGAEAFVLPSRHEGFGLTCLEAMACGTPVVATAVGALPETVGEAGVLVDPGSDGALADAVEALLDDPGRCERLAAAGRERAARFSWARTAHEMDALLAAEAHIV
jgi:glycosyltransferase involved in cell wall biosynthesis